MASVYSDFLDNASRFRSRVPKVAIGANGVLLAGADEVRPGMVIWTSLVNCMLILSVSAQPILSQYCPCQCSIAKGKGKECDKSRSCRKSAASKKCTCSRVNASRSPRKLVHRRDVCTLLRHFRPCECPSECACHLRHAQLPVAPQLTDVEETPQHDNFDGILVPSCHPAAPVIACSTVHLQPPRSAATLCAVLCRFTI